jgi:hypothetical protein
MKTVSGEAMFEKDAPKTYSYGVRTEEGIIVKFWIPKGILGKNHPDELPFSLDLPSGKKAKANGKVASKKSKSKKSRDEDDEEDDEEEEDEEEDDDDEEDN